MTTCATIALVNAASAHRCATSPVRLPSSRETLSSSSLSRSKVVEGSDIRASSFEQLAGVAERDGAASRVVRARTNHSRAFRERYGCDPDDPDARERFHAVNNEAAAEVAPR